MRLWREQTMMGGGFTLEGGFWSGVNIITLNYHVFLPMILG